MTTQKRIIRNYNISVELYEDIQRKAKRENRTTIRQVEELLKEAMAKHDNKNSHI